MLAISAAPRAGAGGEAGAPQGMQKHFEGMVKLRQGLLRSHECPLPPQTCTPINSRSCHWWPEQRIYSAQTLERGPYPCDRNSSLFFLSFSLSSLLSQKEFTYGSEILHGLLINSNDRIPVQKNLGVD